MQNIGLMMTYNEEDIIEEVMHHNKKFFDKILVLDGSSDRTEEILRSFDNVVYLIKDQDLYPKRKVDNGARQFLLEEAQKRYGYDGWFTVLHGDEIMVDNPLEIAERAQKAKAEKVTWHSLNFFLHTSQINQVFTAEKTIQEQVTYYQPGSLEVRQFKNKKGLFYNLNQAASVLPYNIGFRTLFDFPIFKHYIVRSPQQVQKRPISGFANITPEKLETLKSIPYEACFKDKLYPDLKQVRHYTGSFDEFEPGKRPAFIWQWLNWHRYKKIEW